MKNIFVTGGTGFLGSMLLKLLSEKKNELGIDNIISGAVTEPLHRENSVIYEHQDVRSEKLLDYFTKYNIDCVVHLASIVTPGKKANRAFEYSVDVDGTKNVLSCCLKAKVKRIIVSSSGAAYGYHPENTSLLTESSPIRGNQEFAYSHHKRLVEEELARYRIQHPELEQTIFRIGTILGSTVNNQISDLFKRAFIIGVYGSSSPFNFILDTDVADCILKAITENKTGIYNLAGDGFLTIDDYCRILKKPKIIFPAWFLKFLLGVLKIFNLTQYGPEQVRFLQYRPVLDNTKLKTEFGFIPKKTSLEVFEFFKKHNLKLT